MALAVSNGHQAFAGADALAIVTEGLDRLEIVHVFGALDFTSAPTLEAALTRAVRIGTPLIADLRECTFIDAAAIGVLARARKALGKLFRVRAASGGFPLRLLEMVGLSGFVDAVT
jgi:anti-anti-sigma factor